MSFGDTTRSARAVVVAVMAVVALATAREACAEVKPLPRAHSHNDYEQARPLNEALDNGVCNIEADIFLVDGVLLVAHTRAELNPERTLQGLYLDPLRARCERGGGFVFPDKTGITLLIDIKDEANATYAVLRTVLEGYADMLTEFRDDQVTQRAVTVVLSGNRPIETLRAEPVRLAGIDGRFDELAPGTPASLFPWVSMSWPSQFSWRGNDPISDEERDKLGELVRKAHANGQRLRFWGTPPRDASVWPVLDAAGVDILGTDDIPKLRAYFEGTAVK